MTLPKRKRHGPIILHGYHYTPERIWLKIMREGLVPQSVVKQEILEKLPGAKGTWVWQAPLSPVSHAGTVLFQAVTKASPRIALLEVAYTMADVALDEGKNGFLSNKHRGALASWVYHVDEPGYLLVRHVPIERIRLIAVYDIVEALAHHRWTGEQLCPSSDNDLRSAITEFDWSRAGT